MTERRLCAAWYLPLERRPAPPERLGQLVERAGMTEVEVRHWSGTGRPTMLGAWGGLDCEADLLPLAYFDSLVLTFREDEFQSLAPGGGDSLAEDGALGLAYAFRDACVALDPVSAFVTGHAWDDPFWYVAHEEEPVLNGHVVALTREPLALLYLPPADVSELAAAPDLAGRDTLPLPDGGLLLFRGRGRDRWQ